MNSRNLSVRVWITSLLALSGFLPGSSARLCADGFAAPLPEGVKAVWDLDKASREATPTSERVCLNGLWRWQPAGAGLAQPPTAAWGYFKVPGCWPGISDYMQKDFQRIYPHPLWKETRLAAVSAAWYERELKVPDRWAGRHIGLAVEYVNSHAVVFVDGNRAGEIRFPGGDVDLTPACHPGRTFRLSMLVVAMPLSGVMLSYNDTALARQVKGTVARRGLCGDVFLVATSAGARIRDVRVETSVRKGQITLDTGLQGLDREGRYSLRARIARAGRALRELASKPLTEHDLEAGRTKVTFDWKPEDLWDVNTPSNIYSLCLSLLDHQGRLVDTALDVRFGFRELWIDGRDFYLNGKRIFLSALPIDNAQIGAALAGYASARETMERLKSFGINLVYTHNYGCEPGSHLSFAEILRAADDVGMLVSFSQPHFSHYDWRSDSAERDNGYRAHAEFYVRCAQNHPSVVFYSMSHNATGYEEDMNPALIDGLHDPREAWGQKNAKLALRAEAIVRRLDPSRIVYHHASGNLGSMHAINFYPNFAPIQELSDWFEHWARAGTKPVFTCEYGAPFTWDWSMYRGWYKGERSFGSAAVPWEFCLAEWNAQFVGDRAFHVTEMEKANLRWEANQFRAGRLWHRWDYPYELSSPVFDDRHTVMGMYLADNLRAYRTWGVSATSPWEYGHFWRLRDGVDKGRRELPVDWDALQRPGFSADYLGDRFERMDVAFERSDWVATADGQAVLRNNRPLLAYISGPHPQFTGKSHNVYPGAAIEKQIMVINDSRTPVTCDARWSLEIPVPIAGRHRVSVPPGQRERIPVNVALPATLAPGQYLLRATVAFSSGETQEDRFAIDVVRRPPEPDGESRQRKDAAESRQKFALFDPKGETTRLLDAIGVAYGRVGAATDLSPYETLIVGKEALTVDGPAPSIERVRAGLKVVVFEQTARVLERRLGFRVVEYGLRQVFPRLSGHPLLTDLAAANLQDWCGEATILPPALSYISRPRYGPTVTWCDIPVTRVWRCGNRGNVASVLIEKPGRGNFLPIVDGGFGLHYSPLMEYRTGRGLVLFCQLDVTGRTEADPAALALARNILAYALSWKPATRRDVAYAGEEAGMSHLRVAGIAARPAVGANLSPDQVLVVGPGGGKALAAAAPAIADWLKSGGRVLAIGLDSHDADAFLPFKVRMRKAEHIATSFGPFEASSPLAGIGPADALNRDPRLLPKVVAGLNVIGDGVLGYTEGERVVFCQLVPWQFEPDRASNVKRTFRRTTFLVSRLLANMGVESASPVLDRFRSPVGGVAAEQRWRTGLYLDQPEESDDPYRFFRW